MAEQHEVGDLVNNIAADIRTIVRSEIELAKAEVIPGAKKAGAGAAVLGGAAMIAGLALNLLLIALGFLFTNLIFWGRVEPAAAFAYGFLCAFGVYLIVAIILAAIGVRLLKKLTGPTSAIAEKEATIAAVQDAVSQGLVQVDMFAATNQKKVIRDESGAFASVLNAPRRAASKD